MSHDTVARRRSLWPGLITAVAAAPCAIVLAVPGHTGLSDQSVTVYDRGSWLLLALVVVAGIGLIIRDHGAVARVAATTGAIAAVQLVTTGLVAAKHWRPLTGMAGLAPSDLPVLILLAWVLVVAAATATATCLVAARMIGLRRHGSPDAYRWIAAAIGVVIALGLPPVLGSGNPQNMDARSLAAYMLLYALPWGATIAISGWLTRIGRITALITVALCAAGAVVSHTMIWVMHPTRGFLSIISVTFALTLLTQARCSVEVR